MLTMIDYLLFPILVIIVLGSIHLGFLYLEWSRVGHYKCSAYCQNGLCERNALKEYFGYPVCWYHSLFKPDMYDVFYFERTND